MSETLQRAFAAGRTGGSDRRAQPPTVARRVVRAARQPSRRRRADRTHSAQSDACTRAHHARDAVSCASIAAQQRPPAPLVAIHRRTARHRADRHRPASGRPRTTAVAAFVHGGTLAVAAMNLGSERNPSLVAQPRHQSAGADRRRRTHNRGHGAPRRGRRGRATLEHMGARATFRRGLSHARQPRHSDLRTRSELVAAAAGECAPACSSRDRGGMHAMLPAERRVAR